MEKPIHILVIRFSALGDVAMMVPVLRNLAVQHPEVKITVLSKPFVAPLFKDIPNLTFFGADVAKTYKGLRGLFQLFKELSQLQITHVADLHNVLRSKVLRLLFRLKGTPLAYIDKGRAEKKALTRTKNKVFKQLKTSHQRYAEVFERLGFLIQLQPSYSPKKPLTPNTETVVKDRSTPWIGIAPFAAHQGKTYPLDLVKELLSATAKKDLSVFLFGGGTREITLLNELATTYPHCTAVAGKLTFEEELNLISQLTLMVSMDSGNAHLAAMFGVPTLTLWGVTHPYAGFAPIHQPEDYCILPDLKKYPNIPCSIYGNKVSEGYEDVMRSIAPSRVMAKIEDILDQKRVS